MKVWGEDYVERPELLVVRCGDYDIRDYEEVK